jgi:RNA polymerase sigma-70 factor (ECF subfamily)
MQGDTAPHRKRLFSIAYRMLGSASEAEDVLQDAWVRWQAASGVENAEAWLVRTVSRLCLDRLKSSRHQRETYVGPWLPEPLATTAEEVDPESLSVAFLILLERLTPVERAVFLLHRVFDYSHAEIAEILQQGEAAVRQSLHRAKEHLAQGRPRFAPTKDRHAELLSAFATAARAGDLVTLKSLLAADAKAWSDGGGKARAALNVVSGRHALARFFVGLGKTIPDDGLVEVRELNGLPSLVLWANGRATTVLGVETDGERIFAIHIVVNPDKLASLKRS